MRELTILEKGNLFFEIHETVEDPTKIIIWECFTDEQAFKEHLISLHLQYFIKLDLVELENGYATNKIA